MSKKACGNEFLGGIGLHRFLLHSYELFLSKYSCNEEAFPVFFPPSVLCMS
jgi:hypothetical protein